MNQIFSQKYFKKIYLKKKNKPNIHLKKLKIKKYKYSKKKKLILKRKSQK